MTEIDQYEFTDIQGQHHSLILEKDGHDRWAVHCFVDESHSWSVYANPDLGADNPRSRQPFNREEARAEFERWRPRGA